jgi:hypothetical protein
VRLVPDEGKSVGAVLKRRCGLLREHRHFGAAAGAEAVHMRWQARQSALPPLSRTSWLALSDSAS